MIITKISLPRRTFLRGMGASIALPLLDGMVPALSAISKTAANPVQRLGFFYVPNGMYPGSFHPVGQGKNFELSPILTPLAPYRDQMIAITGLSNAEAAIGGGGPHTRAHAVFLNGTAPKATEGADIQAGTTIDQYAARVIGADTPLPSLELALEPNSFGICDNGYSCVYVNTFSWRTPTTPVPMENNPRVVFERMFGDGGTPAVRLAEMKNDRSILDWVTDDLTRLQRRLGAGDRARIDGYLDAVRDVEKRIQRTETQSLNSPTKLATQPIGIPDDFEVHAKLMFDLQFLAYQADVTRVATFQIAREQSARTYPSIGVAESHHNVSHHNNQPDNIAKNTKINTYHMSLFAGLVEKMRATPDGDGTLLDHAMLLYGSGFGDGNVHMPRNMNVVMVGGGCGQLQGGRHLAAPMDTPMMNLGLSLLDKVGVHLDKLGDSTGRLADI
jgi:hypothetical protein